MTITKKSAGLGVVVFIVVLIVALAAIPPFLGTDSFRTRIEDTLSHTLNRKVTVGKLSISLLTGSLDAEDATLADDPHFSTQPFIQAANIKIKVEVLPLLLHRQIHIRGFILSSPRIQVIRAPNGVWNYSSVGVGGDAAKPAGGSDTSSTFPNLSVGHVEVDDGRLTVSVLSAPGKPSTPSRVYDQLSLNVDDFGFSKPFPFKATAHLPGDGSVKINGTAGPINPQDTSLTPFAGHLQLQHIDLVAAGFADASDGLTGTLGEMTLDAVWSGQAMHVTSLLIGSPNLAIVRSSAQQEPTPAASRREGASMLRTLSVDKAEIKNGTLTVSTPGQAAKPAIYQQLDATLRAFGATTPSPFSARAQLPGGGSFAASGNVGPINFDTTATTPLVAQVDLKHVELETSGVIPPDAGIKGLTDLQAQIRSNGEVLNATGSAHIDGLQLANNGSPSKQPVDTQFTLMQNEKALTGQLQSATINIGKAAVNVAGSYQASGATTAINLKVTGHAMPVDELEAFLPAAGVRLPQGSQLQGGTLTCDLQVSGSTASPVINGPVRLENSKLAGFDLGSKLQTLSQITGGRIGSATGNGTTIRSLSMNVTQSAGNTRTDKIVLDVAGVGTATGAGVVASGGGLDYNVILKLTGLLGQSGAAQPVKTAAESGGLGALAGGLSGLIPGGGSGGSPLSALGSVGGLASGVLRNGIPVAIGGTVSNPTFAPNLAGLVSGAALGPLQGLTGQKGPHQAPSKPLTDQLQNALGGLFKKE